jgi:phospholipid/cholesterol/gamma-HCH transport system ATP-binding protein
MTAPFAPESSPAVIAVRDLWTRLGERWVHRGVTLEVQPGESVAVIGGSGSGKSTLLRVMIGLEDPERGEVVVDGVRMNRATKPEIYGLMSRVGVLFQFGALFDSLTVWENVAFALRKEGLSEVERRRVAIEKLKMVGLRDVEDLVPAQLSGGMRKRAALARAIAHEPEILFCDEPTAGLDPVLSDVITELILQMRDRLGVTTVTITHDLRSAYKLAERIALLYEGQVLVCESPERIRASENPIVRQFVEGRAQGPLRSDEAGGGLSGP